MMEISQSQIKSTVTGNTKFYYRIDQRMNVMIVFAADIGDKDEHIFPLVEAVTKAFSQKFGSIFEQKAWKGDRSIFKSFMEEIDKIVLGPIKVSIIGVGGVGKTTLLRLIIGKELNLEYIPTVNADIANFDGLGTRQIVLWDFAGQQRYNELWNSLLRDTRIVLLVTDSTYQNAQESKKILTNVVQKHYSNVIVIGIANKQDLPNRLTPEFLQKILGIPVYSMIGINPDYRIKIHELLRKYIDEVNKQDNYVPPQAVKESTQN